MKTTHMIIKNLQQKVFDTMRDFFNENTPIITTQLNDANQDSNSSQRLL